MLRQIYEALRFAIADFFDVPWQGVVAMFGLILLALAYGFARTFYFGGHYVWLRLLLAAAMLIVLAIGREYLRKR